MDDLLRYELRYRLHYADQDWVDRCADREGALQQFATNMQIRQVRDLWSGEVLAERPIINAQVEWQRENDEAWIAWDHWRGKREGIIRQKAKVRRWFIAMIALSALIGLTVFILSSSYST